MYLKDNKSFYSATTVYGGGRYKKNVYNNVLKPAGKHVGKIIIINPTSTLQMPSPIGVVAASKTPLLKDAGLQAEKFGYSGKSVKIRELTTGRGLYLTLY